MIFTEKPAIRDSVILYNASSTPDKLRAHIYAWLLTSL